MLTKVQKTIESALAGKELPGGSALGEAIGALGGVGAVAQGAERSRLFQSWSTLPGWRGRVSRTASRIAPLKGLQDVRIP
ncbi:MAG: hypothetical protein NTV24_05055, partial [Candidatus Woesebacteria bacterium]|nr:hypothetical protein [Candidatus Woesebacteria bacterium]